MTLPDKPSELLLLALADLEKAEADSNYFVSMSHWHSSVPSILKCFVCMAGSVMAFSLNASLRERRDPTDYPDRINDQLRAIDYLRCGEIEDGLDRLGIPMPANLQPSFYVRDYIRSHADFKADIKSLIALLQTYSL